MPTVLLVDDDDTVRLVIRKTLAEMGYVVRETGSGDEALAAIADGMPDVMILDLLMPEPNGLIVLDRLQRAGLTAQLPILVITGSITPESSIREAGARGVLRKPFTAAQLRGTMTALVLHKRLNRERPPRRGWFWRPYPPSVLIVEDDEETRQMLETLLQLEGYTTVTASNGVEGLARMRTRRPRAVLLDVMVPVMDGREFRDAQLQEPALADIPVICLTPAGNPAELESDLRAPCFGKPFDMDAILSALQERC